MSNCSFCGNKIEKGTGMIFVFKTGKLAYFCSSKCERNMLRLKRKSRTLKWTKNFEKEQK
ncbi:MAG: 50S ribosomal protein L24e [archaeon]